MKAIKVALSAVLVLLLTVSFTFGTVSSSTSRITYSCNGATVAFPFTFGTGATSEIDVILTTSAGVETTLTETTHYAVTCTNSDCESGGTVTTVATYASGNTITIIRDVPLTQESDFTENMPTLYETFEDALDKNIRIDQQQQEEIDRTPKLKRSSAYAGNAYTFPDPEAGKVIGWNAAASDLTTFVVSGGTIDVDTLIKVSDYGNSVNTAVAAIGATEATLLIDVAATCTDDLTVPSNVNLWFFRGGSVAITAAKTLTIYSPDHINANSTQQIFAGAGTVAFSNVRGEIYPEWWGAVTGGSTDCGPAINAAITAASSSAAGGYSVAKVVFKGGVYLTKETLIFKPFVNYEGIRSTTANTAATYTTLTDSHGTVIRAHAEIYTDDNNTAGVLVYVASGDMQISNITFVGTAAINANPSVGIQFGSSGGTRTHEGTDSNVSGVNLHNVTFYTFLTAWEVYNLNDTYSFNARFESNTTSIGLIGRATGAYGGTIELHGTIIYASAYGVAIYDTANFDFHMVGGAFEGTTAAQDHIAISGTKLPDTVGGYFPSFRFDGVSFRHANAASYHALINKDFTDWEGFFAFNNCYFQKGIIYIAMSAGATPANAIYFNSPVLTSSYIDLTSAEDIRISEGVFDNSYITATDIISSKILNNHFKNATGSAVTAITIDGTSSATEVIGNSGDASVTDLINAVAGIYRADNRADPDSENTWTAAMTCGTSGTITLDGAWDTGYFIKAGRVVTVTGLFQVASVNAPVGTLTITGLPFTASAGAQHYAAAAIHITGLTADATNPHYQGIIAGGGTSIVVSKVTAGDAAALAGDIKAGSYIGINATYFTD